MQWPWRQHTAGSGSQPRRTEIGSGTREKMYSMCRIYTQNVYTLYYEEAHAHTQREKHVQETQETSELQHLVCCGSAQENYRPCRKIPPSYKSKIWWRIPHILPCWLDEMRNEGRLWAPFWKFKNGTPYSLIDSTYKWRQDWKQGLKYRIQSHRGKKKKDFVFPAFSL